MYYIIAKMVLMFQKTNSISPAFQKQTNSASIFARKFNNTMKDINSVALPALGIASLVAPEFAPVFGGIGLGLKGGQAAAEYGNKAAAQFVGGNNRPPVRPALQR